MGAPAAFARKNRANFVNGWRLFRLQPRFKVAFILLFAIICEAGLWELFAAGFDFLERLGGMAGVILGRLFSLFYLGMGMMLVASGVVTSFATLYRSEEVPYLLVRPLPVAQVVLYKFFESAYLSSWAFMFIVIPFVGAYAMHQRVSLLFAIWTLLYSVPFLVICSGIGTLFIQVCVRWWPRRISLKPVLAIAGLGLAWVVWRTTQAYEDGEGTRFALSALVPGMRLSGNLLIPSTWLAEGVHALSRGEWLRGALFGGVLFASAAALAIFVEALGGLTFLTGWERVNEGGTRSGRASRIFRRFDRLLGFLPGDVRGLIMKDVRTFFRDPMQWSQVVIFFGLLGMYFVNLRRFHYDTYSPQWRNMVCFLNVFSVSSVLCSLGARFIYPQLSLEGQGFWLLGLSPTSMRRVLLSKFVLALVCMGSVSMLLIGVSSAMLKVDGLLMGVSVGVVGCVVMTICGLSTGLGAIFMDLRQRNPAAIVGGFGGTVNLVLGLSFMLAAILPFGLVFHLHAGGMVDAGFLHRGTLYGALWCAFLTTVATVSALTLGFRALRDRDY